MKALSLMTVLLCLVLTACGGSSSTVSREEFEQLKESLQVQAEQLELLMSTPTVMPTMPTDETPTATMMPTSTTTNTPVPTPTPNAAPESAAPDVQTTPAGSKPAAAPVQPTVPAAKKPASATPAQTVNITGYGLPPQPYISHPSFYQETGVGQTRTWTISVLDGATLIYGGFTVGNESNGVYGAIKGPKNVTITISDGFISIVTNNWANQEYCFRLSQAKQYGWAHSHLHPLPGWTCP